MRILHDNILSRVSDDKVKGLNTVEYHPFRNLYSPRLADTYNVNTRLTTEITIEFDSPQSISCFLLANHTLIEFDITFLDDDNPIKTYRFDHTETQKDVILFYPSDLNREADNVRLKFIKTKYSGGISIGGMYLGRYIQMPPFNSKPKIGSRYTGKASTSPDGLVFPQQGLNLRTFNCEFNAIRAESFNDIKAIKGIIQNDVPMWVDFYPENHDAFSPMFVRNTGRFNVSKAEEGLVFDKLKLKLEECK